MLTEEYSLKDFIIKNKIIIIIIALLLSFISYRTLNKTPHHAGKAIEIQAHLGGLGEYFENTITAFDNAIKAGVDTLQFGVILTKDNIPIVWNDTTIQNDKCTDTTPAFAGDLDYPYVGKNINSLDYQQIITVNCGDKTLKAYPKQKPVAKSKILSLVDFYQYIKGTNYTGKIAVEVVDNTSMLNSDQQKIILTRIINSKKQVKLTNSLNLQSVNWDILNLAKELFPTIITGGIYSANNTETDILNNYRKKFKNNNLTLIELAKLMHLNELIPQYPYYKGENNPPNSQSEDLKTYVTEIHKANLKIIIWPINTKTEVDELKTQKVDGIITDYPNAI